MDSERLKAMSDRDLDAYWIGLGMRKDRLEDRPLVPATIARTIEAIEEIEEEQRQIRRETWRRAERKSLGG